MFDDLIEKYKLEMLNMYKSVAVPTQVTMENQNFQEPQPPTENAAQSQQTAPNENIVNENGESVGYLSAVVSTIRSLYPVPNAEITIFTGTYPEMNIIATDITDQSGKSKTFTLPTPQKSFSLDSNNINLPYSKYNMMVSADGYLDNVHLNIPVFSGVKSVQRSNMLLRETAGENKGAQIFDEENNYNL